MNLIRIPLAVLIGIAAYNSGHPAYAKAGHTYAFGAPGKADEAARTIEVNLADNYYEPDKITVKPGETIRFVLKNSGEFLHEFNIDTMAAHAEHRKEMAAMMEMGMISETGIDPGKMNMDHSKMAMGGAKKSQDMQMMHDDPNNVMLKPGETRELVWKFSKTMEIEFACNMPGHYESGMMGRIGFDK